MAEDIFELKPGMYGLNVNIRALLRRFASGGKKNPTLIVAERFLSIFEDHGVAISQIPRLVPNLSLDQLQNPESLRPALTPEILRDTARLFQIKLSWLEGITDQIYDYDFFYKDPWRFFDDFRKLNREDFFSPIAVFCSTTKLNYEGGRGQLIVPVLREKCAQFGDNVIYRYHIYDEFDWGYQKCRIQLKAMVRILEKKLKVPVVPMYQINKKILKGIESGRIVPRQYYGREKTDPSLEDYSLSPEESAVSKEADELPIVLNYIKAYKLDDNEKISRLFKKRFF